jgi:serine/threonine protein kinase
VWIPDENSHHYLFCASIHICGSLLQLGKGAFAKVFIGFEKSTGHEYAVKKIYDRSKMKWNGRDALMDEIGNLQKLRQAPNIVYLHEYFLEQQQCFLVMELLPGKELFERIIQKSIFTEEEARNSCRCVLSALAFMHERRMAHRDLKPENLLLVVRTVFSYGMNMDSSFP